MACYVGMPNNGFILCHKFPNCPGGLRAEEAGHGVLLIVFLSQ